MDRGATGRFVAGRGRPGLDACKRCGKDISGLRQRKDRQWCGRRCSNAWRREQRRIAARLARPRCAICSNPLPYGKSGFTLKAVTCGRPCAIKFSNWYKRKSCARTPAAA